LKSTNTRLNILYPNNLKRKRKTKKEKENQRSRLPVNPQQNPVGHSSPRKNNPSPLVPVIYKNDISSHKRNSLPSSPQLHPRPLLQEIKNPNSYINERHRPWYSLLLNNFLFHSIQNQMHLYNAWLPPPVAEETKKEKDSFRRVLNSVKDSYKPDDPDSVYSTLKWVSVLELLVSASFEFSFIWF